MTATSHLKDNRCELDDGQIVEIFVHNNLKTRRAKSFLGATTKPQKLYLCNVTVAFR